MSKAPKTVYHTTLGPQAVDVAAERSEGTAQLCSLRIRGPGVATDVSLDPKAAHALWQQLGIIVRDAHIELQVRDAVDHALEPYLAQLNALRSGDKAAP